MSGVPKFLGDKVYGVRIDVTDRQKVQPVELGVYMAYTYDPFPAYISIHEY